MNELISYFILMANTDHHINVEVLDCTQETLVEAAEILDLPTDDYWLFDGIKKGEVVTFSIDRNNSTISFWAI